MKTVSNTLKLGTALFLVFVVTVGTAPHTIALAGESSAACTRITSMAASTNSTIATRGAKMQADFNTRLSNITTSETKVDQNVATYRPSLMSKFDIKITNLKARADLTPLQLTAIETYATNMKKAEATREAAVDVARHIYRTALSDAVATHQKTLTTASLAFQTSVSSALIAAEANCSNGTSLSTLKATIKAARQTFTVSRQSNKATNNIQGLSQTRNIAIKTADTNFKTLAATYRATLATALKTQ